MNKKNPIYNLLIVLAVVLTGTGLWFRWFAQAHKKEMVEQRTANPSSNAVTQLPPDQIKFGDTIKTAFEKMEKAGVAQVIPPTKQFLEEAIATKDKGKILRAFQDVIYARFWKVNAVVPVLKEFLNDPDPFVRLNAAKDLFTVGDNSGSSTLLLLVKADAPIEGIGKDVRISAAETLE